MKNLENESDLFIIMGKYDLFCKVCHKYIKKNKMELHIKEQHFTKEGS